MNKIQWNFNQNSYIFIQGNAFKISSGKWRPFCLGLNVLNQHWSRTWINNYTHSFLWDVITLPCPNFKTNVGNMLFEFRAWMNNYIPQTLDVITYSCSGPRKTLQNRPNLCYLKLVAAVSAASVCCWDIIQWRPFITRFIIVNIL